MKLIARFARAAVLTAGTLLVCTGCAMKFNAESAAHIQTIAFASFAEPTIIAATQFVMRVDVIGPESTSFSDLLARQNLRLGIELKAAIAKELEADGYRVIDDSLAADAVLEMRISGAPPVNAPAYAQALINFEPEFIAVVRLRDVKGKRTLFNRLYLYRDNSFSPLDGSLLIHPDAKYGFSTAQALFDNPSLAAEGFRAGISTIAKSVGESLRRP